jgi:hypothetical protein
MPASGRRERSTLKAETVASRRLSLTVLGPLAQLVEQGTLNPKVEGSIPSRPTAFAGLSTRLRVPWQYDTPSTGAPERHLAEHAMDRLVDQGLLREKSQRGSFDATPSMRLRFARGSVLSVR